MHNAGNVGSEAMRYRMKDVARKFLPKPLRHILRTTLHQLKSSCRLVSCGTRLVCLFPPGISGLAKRRLSLQSLAKKDGRLSWHTRRAQFIHWYPQDLEGQIRWYGRGGWECLVPEPLPDGFRELGDRSADKKNPLRVAARAFFENYSPEMGKKVLTDAMGSLREGDALFIYAPHEFAFSATNHFAWVPNWKDLYQLAKANNQIRIKNFNAGFDRNGFFHFVVERDPLRKESSPEATEIRTAHFFYMNAGSSRLNGHSNRVLSSAGLRVLKEFAGPISEHYFLDRIPEEATVGPKDIAMGHYGPWVTTARGKGALTILYGPGDRFKERPEPYYADMQARGTFREQYLASHMVIMQAGGFWRIESPWTFPGLCRWIHIPVSPAVFPRTKNRIAPRGRRIFCFIGLYNEEWKGSRTARKIMELCPDFRFIAIGCEPFQLPNCTEYPKMDNRGREFRRIVTQADFVVVPSREDSEPGTVAECSSFGLLPIVSEFAGYVLSFPNRVDVDNLHQFAATLRTAQEADEETVRGWQMLNAQYIEQFHRPEVCEALLRFYIEEACSEFCREKNMG